MMRLKGGSIWGGYLAPWDKLAFGINVGQKYLMENTTLGIPALFQTEGLSHHPYLFIPVLSNCEHKVYTDSLIMVPSGPHLSD